MTNSVWGKNVSLGLRLSGAVRKDTLQSKLGKRETHHIGCGGAKSDSHFTRCLKHTPFYTKRGTFTHPV